MITATDNMIADKQIEASTPNFARSYSSLLDQYGVRYTTLDYYYQVGEIIWTQGWILHISVIAVQFEQVLSEVIPDLITMHIPFKIVANLELAKSVLNGQLGYTQLGKLMSVYPCNEEQAAALAKKLIFQTRGFRGPAILTDRHLGSAVYTRYGSCKPVIRINEKGQQDKYIYDALGKLVKDEYTIPFLLPSGIHWPFGEIASAITPQRNSILKDKYKPVTTLKEDARGEVKKALWLGKGFQIKWCVIKEGKWSMVADDHGRDIQDRLKWQYELHSHLHQDVSIPKVYDLFEENGDLYLIMEYIKGRSLDDVIKETFQYNPWLELPISSRQRLLHYALQILEIVEQLHEKGYVHRDITSANFLVNNKNNLVLIDLELAYLLPLHKPFPPFRFGTTWFMSPQQELDQTPSRQDDIYSLGATLIVLLTGLYPSKFSTGQMHILKDQLYFFIRDMNLVNTIVSCFSYQPSSRPSLQQLTESIKSFQSNQRDGLNYKATLPPTQGDTTDSLKSIITSALASLASPQMMNTDHLWWSKFIQDDALAYYQAESYTVYGGFYVGLSGVLSLLAKAKQMGFSISPCMQGYTNSLAFIRKKYLHRLTETSAGLFGGTAGFAIALAEGMKSGLIPNQDQSLHDMATYLLHDAVSGLGVERGLAGQGIALLRCSSMPEEPLLQERLVYIVNQLMQAQQTDGSWLSYIPKHKKGLKLTGLDNGIAGIACFLLAYSAKYNDDSVRDSAIRAMNWLVRHAHKCKKEVIWYLHNRSSSAEIGFSNGLAGIAFAFIKAYEVIGDIRYRSVAESALRNFPRYMINRDITFSNGLTGIGEVYIEAANAFKSQQWYEQSNWIKNVLVNNMRQEPDDSLFWIVDTTASSTADLMLGNAGIIHFLIRFLYPDKISDPLFPEFK